MRLYTRIGISERRYGALNEVRPGRVHTWHIPLAEEAIFSFHTTIIPIIPSRRPRKSSGQVPLPVSIRYSDNGIQADRFRRVADRPPLPVTLLAPEPRAWTFEIATRLPIPSHWSLTCRPRHLSCCDAPVWKEHRPPSATVALERRGNGNDDDHC